MQGENDSVQSKDQGKRGRPVSPQAAHRRLAEVFREHLARGEWPAGTVIPPLRTLAARHGAGQRAVGLALGMLKQEGLLALNAQRRLVAKAAGSAASFAGNVILELISYPMPRFFLYPYQIDAQRGIFHGAGDLNATVLVACERELQERLPAELLGLPLRGVVLWGHFKPALLRRYEKVPFPVVLLDKPGGELKLHSVSVDNPNAAFDATMRLLELGHRRIAFLRFVSLQLSDVDWDSRERLQGFQRALRTCGIRGVSGQAFSVVDQGAKQSSAAGFFEAAPRFTAALASNVACAGWIIKAARLRGLEVPRDLSVVGFQEKARPPMPVLSGPRIDFYGLSRLAVQTLQAPRQEPRRLRFSAEWAEGKTLAPSP